MPEKHFLFGIAGLVVGLIAGLVIGGNSSDSAVRDAVAEAMSDIEAQVEETTSASRDAVAALDERFDAIEAAVSENASAATGAAEEMGARIAEIGAAVEQGFNDTADRVAALATPSAEEPTQETSQAETGTEAGTETIAASEAPEGGIGAGETAMLADGAVRVFVSRVMNDAARLSVNGALQTVAVGDSVSAGDCEVTLDAAGGGKAAVSARCGGATDAQPGETGDASGGLRPGETAILADGALRVFVSGVTGDGAARIAVNGVETATVQAGESVEADDCTVTVAAVGDGRVALDGTCG